LSAISSGAGDVLGGDGVGGQRVGAVGVQRRPGRRVHGAVAVDGARFLVAADRRAQVRAGGAVDLAGREMRAVEQDLGAQDFRGGRLGGRAGLAGGVDDGHAQRGGGGRGCDRWQGEGGEAGGNDGQWGGFQGVSCVESY
jgi:hypothetical protein